MTIASTLAAIETAAKQVTGLRVTHAASQVNTPQAIVEVERIIAPGSLDNNADYRIRVLLLVQLGDFRDSLDRILALVEPNGAVASSLMAALLSLGSSTGDVMFEGPGLVEYRDQVFGGGVFTFEVYD